MDIVKNWGIISLGMIGMNFSIATIGIIYDMDILAPICLIPLLIACYVMIMKVFAMFDELGKGDGE